MRVSDLLDLDWRAAKKPQLLESFRAFNQVTGEDLKWVGNFAAKNLSLSQQFPPQKQEKQPVICKMLPDKTLNEKAAELMLTRPELMLQVHAKHMHVPSGGGGGEKPGIFGGGEAGKWTRQQIKRCPCCVCGGICGEEPRPLGG